MQVPLSRNAQELYDSIMKDIETDLMLSELPKLAEKYKNESEEETAKRGQRYFMALKKCADIFRETMDKSEEDAANLNEFAIGLLKEFSEKHDAGHLSSLEEQILQQ